ncbi:hypothetical protein EV195_107109 [Tenacibaculum skagerrakense]|uniref:DUF6265 domain-containing protein n=1 Tax=Tenacibaculum skagerrakense TaxID=186571 RepID=A0A4R2NQ38_9FLAO|nr:DUF6265 family protein [Tenacibaculum skagerrakense]TCP23943.1 hypothetical protein EV195_107109 [Tenacibaculum skagerrakense]
MIGKWKRINEDSTKTTYEIWNANFSGIGYTLQNKDTVFKEILNIISSEGKQYFQVTGVNQEPTLFEITKLTKDMLVCENKKNEFPKEISYWLEKDNLKAKVANDDFSIDFVFERIE